MCASAPSHRYHAMPPRTTEQSHRPRVSDRTVWLPRQPCSLAQLQSPNGIDTRAHETPWNTPRSTLSVGNTKGWMSRTSSSPVSGRKMSLDIPFHRTRNRDVAVKRTPFRWDYSSRKYTVTQLYKCGKRSVCPRFSELAREVYFALRRGVLGCCRWLAVPCCAPLANERSHDHAGRCIISRDSRGLVDGGSV
jgi:hypothetical protein